MFKSIFSKLVISNLSTLILIIFFSSLAYSIGFQNFAFDQKHKTLINAASRINQLANEYHKNLISKDEFSSSINSIGYITDSRIYIAIGNADDNLKNQWQDNLSKSLESQEYADIINKISKGEAVFVKKTYNRQMETSVTITGIPLKTDGMLNGAILFLTPDTTILKNINLINKIIFYVALMAIVLSVIIIYFNSKKLSKPIHEISDYAITIASGKAVPDIPNHSIEEISKLAQSFNYMKLQISNTEKIRKEFIGNVSHDLRTPLTSIKGFVQGMLDNIIDSEDYPKYLAIIKNEVDRLIHLTSDLLELTKIQSGQMQLNIKSHFACKLINEALDKYHFDITKRDVTLQTFCSDDIAVMCDENRTHQILSNIISNAIKYNKDGGNIEILVENHESQIKFHIKDNGIGISDKDIPYVFNEFYRVDKVRTTDISGVGLGLSITKKLVEIQGGNINVISKPDNGTEVIFSLPKNQLDETGE